MFHIYIRHISFYLDKTKPKNKRKLTPIIDDVTKYHISDFCRWLPRGVCRHYNEYRGIWAGPGLRSWQRHQQHLRHATRSVAMSSTFGHVLKVVLWK